MNFLKQMNQAMSYIEEHLTDEIDFKQVARVAGCSEYHFRRMFSYLAGMPLSEYIRSRKLTLAVELLRQDYKVIDCATLLGYESVDAFSRAFQGMHKVTPSEAKRTNTVLKAFLPMTFKLTITGGSKMDYRIEHNKEFKIVGFKKRITLQFEGINSQMDSLYKKLTPERIVEIKMLNNVKPSGILSVSANFNERTEEGTELDQFIGVATTMETPSEYDMLPVAESDWAVFTVIGPFPETVQNTWASIYSEWLPSSEYQLTGGPELLWHSSPDLTKPDCESEIWIPVEKR